MSATQPGPFLVTPQKSNVEVAVAVNTVVFVLVSLESSRATNLGPARSQRRRRDRPRRGRSGAGPS